MTCLLLCSKPIKRAELLARIKAHLRVKSDATWVQSIVKGVLTEDSEAMKILESILPESIITRIQVPDCPERCVLTIGDRLYMTCISYSYASQPTLPVPLLQT